MRIALLTLEALAAAAAVRQFVAGQADRIALVALSEPFRPQRGGVLGQTRSMLARSGPRFLPYLTINFVLPRLAGLLPLRGKRPATTRLPALCARLGIPVALAADMNSDGFRECLQASGAELLVTFHCDQILTAETIAALPRGGINVHAGLLPDHRGPVPTLHALLEPSPRFGVTLHRLAPRIDAGAVLAQQRLELGSSTSALGAALALHAAAVPMLCDVLDRMEAGTLEERCVTSGAYCGFPSREEMRRLARAGRHGAGWRDLLRALRTPV